VVSYGCGWCEHYLALENVLSKETTTTVLPPERAEAANPFKGGAKAAIIHSLVKGQAKAARLAARSAAATSMTKATASRT